ncbi:GDP-D-glucose phosphorylase, variant 3 [Perkinsus olseni]|uniref:GDP-D-glucose phosphorylase, variant 3 n=1 Tax=Perkinsus olseni TaxID=32597 RepID=A0A7J6U6B5_PEROL|nr:GDP-D-glucose phosphorylase, variant 3 [Perkinsus olseni]
MRTDRKRKTNNEGHKERNEGRQLTYSPFAAEDFNFTRVKDDEVIGTLGAGAHALLVNVSPLAYGHCLLCPEYKACRPQVLALDALEVAVAFASAADADRDDMKVTFNSLGAWASVNHLHFHVFWPSGRQDQESPSVDEPAAADRILDSGGCMIPLREPPFGRMPIELAKPKRMLATTSSLNLEELDYPVGWMMYSCFPRQSLCHRREGDLLLSLRSLNRLTPSVSRPRPSTETAAARWLPGCGRSYQCC